MKWDSLPQHNETRDFWLCENFKRRESPKTVLLPQLKERLIAPETFCKVFECCLTFCCLESSPDRDDVGRKLQRWIQVTYQRKYSWIHHRIQHFFAHSTAMEFQTRTGTGPEEAGAHVGVGALTGTPAVTGRRAVAVSPVGALPARLRTRSPLRPLHPPTVH